MLPAGNRLFGTAPVGPEVWLLAVLFAASMWILEEARKLYEEYQNSTPTDFPEIEEE